MAVAAAVALGAAAALCGAGCGSCEDPEADAANGQEGAEGAEGAAAAAPRARAPAPEALLFEASLGGGADTLAALRGLAGRHPLGLVLPTSPGEVVAGLVPGLPIGDAIPADAPVHLVGLGELTQRGQTDEPFTFVGATRLDAAAGTAALGSLVPGGPEGSRWVGPPPAADAPAAAVIDDVLVFGERRDAVEAALPYLAFTAIPRPVDAGLHLRLLAGLGADLQRRGEDAMGEVTAGLLGQAGAERARHDSPPDWGEPEAVARQLGRGATQLLALLPDIGEVRASLTPVARAPSAGSAAAAGGVQVTIDGVVRTGSGLGELLANAPVSDAAGTRALPANTAFALSFFPERGGQTAFDAFGAFRSWREFAGSRLGRRGESAVDALEGAWEAAAGRESILALGGGADDAWVAVVDPAPEGELPPEKIEAVIGTDYVTTMLATAFDCPGRIRPRRGEPLCPNAPSLIITENDGRRAVGLGRAANLFETSDHASLGAYPEVVQTLDALGPNLIATLLVFPSRVMPVIGLSGAEQLQQMSRLSAMAARPAPIAIGISRRGDASETGLRITMVATGAAIEDAVSLLGSL